MNDRYHCVSSLFQEKIGFDFRLYLETPSSKKGDSEPVPDSKVGSGNYVDALQKARISTTEPSNETIEDLCKKIERSKFLIRPVYQRREVINKRKSSILIESILIGIKIPPIFVYKRNDGISEVVDGQQRLLSIIGFMGEEFMNEDGVMMKSDKNLFKLSGLSVLTDLNGKRYQELPEEFQNKLLDFNLMLVTIEQKYNTEFDQVDLFVRLNNKPYPIRENSFEMWNSYIDKDFIKAVKEKVAEHSSWFYLRSPNHNDRMDNEQSYTTLVYLFYLRNQESESFIKFFQRGSSLNARLKDKVDVTKTLEKISSSDEIKIKIEHSMKEVEEFIANLRSIISLNGALPDAMLKNELSGLLSLKTDRRTMQSFYVLWHLLNHVNKHKIEEDPAAIKEKIKELFVFTKGFDEDSATDSFDEKVADFKKQFCYE